MPWDNDAAANYAWRHAHDKSTGYCARYTSNAVDAGLHSHIGRSHQARDFGPSLMQAGFRAMPQGTVPQSGDIVIFPGFKADLRKHVRKDHEAGHMELYDGKHKVWVSDFKQTGLYPGKDFLNSGVQYSIYRYGQ